MRPIRHDTLIEQLQAEGDFCTRARTVLRWENCRTVGDIQRLGWYYLFRSNNVGKQTLIDIANVIGGFEPHDCDTWQKPPAWLPRAPKPMWPMRAIP